MRTQKWDGQTSNKDKPQEKNAHCGNSGRKKNPGENSSACIIAQPKADEQRPAEEERQSMDLITRITVILRPGTKTVGRVFETELGLRSYLRESSRPTTICMCTLMTRQR